MQVIQKYIVLTALWSLFAAKFAYAELTVAVAANFTAPMKEVSRAFTKDSGVTIRPVFASTGKLFAMIKNGGPFDMFFAADTKRPAILYDENLAQKPFIYAKGSTVLWTNKKKLCSFADWQTALKNAGNIQLSIANPELAPYGAAAMKALQSTSMTDVSQRLVYGQNVAQAFAIAWNVTGLGFTAASVIQSEQGQKGCWWPVDPDEAIEQSACIINGGQQQASAEKFASFLVSPKAKGILSTFGYRD